MLPSGQGPRGVSAVENKPRRGPYFWGGLMAGGYGAVAGLAMAGAIEGAAVVLLMLAPTILIIPLIRSANRRLDTASSCYGKGEAQRRYKRRVMLFTALYLLSFGILTLATKASEPEGAWRGFLAVLPALAVIGIFWAIGRLIVEEQDEFMRMLVVRQSLIASGLSLSAASVWGFLESADVVVHVDAYWWPVSWFLGLAVGAVMNRIDYGAWGAT